MFVAVDVDYRPTSCVAAGVWFERWEAQAPTAVTRVTSPHVDAYEPGAFWKRELPPLLALLGEAPTRPSLVLIDGYVWLSEDGRRGLGAHLFEALGGQTPVVGVAKTAFRGSAWATKVLRGASVKPLFVTSAGLDQRIAADCVRRMHGEARLPTLLRAVDSACRALDAGS